ncbi:hypothetical protein AAFC00_005581 [Neodothiora populina]|uniref:NADH:ubiquinone oxidoreductase intermediate-associated protein 30 domain-containing protein n=1 Tax=Neodothiora populina TaxID=2781224 RepID=A0ABR3PLC6_9PEZI
MSETGLALFGGLRPWDSSDWTASDDRVRGGESQSYLECSDTVGRFHGELDIKTLGGAGFASQRTVGEESTWNLSGLDGIMLKIAESDGKRYTFILKDDLLPRNPENGREQSTTSYEYDFEISEKDFIGGKAKGDTSIFVPWHKLKPTYRGKVQKDAHPLNLSSVKRISIMMRSFFGDQEGPFSLSIRSIEAVKSPEFTHSKYDIEKSGPISMEHESKWSSRITTLKQSLTPRRLCGLALAIVAICYLQAYTPHCLRR